MEQEHVFAEEAQEEALLSRNVSLDNDSPIRTQTEDRDDLDNESSPLIGTRMRKAPRAVYSRAGESYQKAIDEPWTGAHGAGSLPWYKKPSIYWLLPAFFPYCLAFGGIIVPKQYLILDLICNEYLSDQAAHDPNFKFMPVILGEKNPQCRDPNVQALTSRFNLYMSLIAGILSAITTPHFGTLSDRVGRTKVIVWASVGGFCAEIITILVGTNPERFGYRWLLLGSVMDGLCGSFTTGMALAFAYATDCTPPEIRNTAFGYFHGTLFAGVGFGPLIAAAFIKLTGSIMTVFYIAVACHAFFITFIALVIPESLSKERQLQAREKYDIRKSETSHKTWAATLKSYNFFEPLWVLRPRGPGSSPALRRNLFLLAAIDTMMFGVAMGTMSIILIYAEYMYGWDEIAASQFLSAVNICRVAGLIGLLPLLTRIFRGPKRSRITGHKGSDMLDINIIRGSILFDLIGYIGYAFAPTGAVMVLSGIVASLGGIGSPTLQSSLTKHIPADRSGQVLGASGLLHALARVVAPLVFNLIYSKTVKTYAGFVFICLASTFVIVFIMSWFLKPNVCLNDAPEADTHDDDEQIGRAQE